MDYKESGRTLSVKLRDLSKLFERSTYEHEVDGGKESADDFISDVRKLLRDYEHGTGAFERFIKLEDMEDE